MTFIDTTSTAPLQAHYPGSATPGMGSSAGQSNRPNTATALNAVPTNLLLGRNKAFPPRCHHRGLGFTPKPGHLLLPPYSKSQDAEERK